MRIRMLSQITLIVLLAVVAAAQAATRPVVLSWTASTSTSVTGYSIYRCTAPCTLSVTGTPIGTTAGTTYTDNPTSGFAYNYGVVANAPACTGTSSITTPCGNSAPATASVPVPPQTLGPTAFQFAVP